MCGICGYVNLGTPKNLNKPFRKMLTRCEVRGSDATGLFAWNGIEGRLIKMDSKATEMVRGINWKTIKEISVCLGHTRLATQGTTALSSNNHPLYDGKNYLLTHNGIIWNSTDFGVLPHQTDSFAILEAIQEGNTNRSKKQVRRVIKGINQLSGDMACALMDIKSKQVYLWRSGNPLVFGLKDEVLWYASTYEIMNLKSADFIGELKDDTLLHIDLNTKQLHTHEIETHADDYAEVYSGLSGYTKRTVVENGKTVTYYE